MIGRLPRVLLALLAAVALSESVIDDAIDIIKFSKEIGEEVLSSWDILGKTINSTGGVDLPIIKRRERLILSRLSEISRQITKLELSLDINSAVVFQLARNSGRSLKLELQLNEISSLLGRVASADARMRQYMGFRKELERSTLQSFAESCVSHKAGALPELLERIHRILVPGHDFLRRGLLENIADVFQEDNPDLCDMQMSPHQVVYDMYNTAALAEIKGYAMMQFSWMLLRVYGEGNFTLEASLTRDRYDSRSAKTAAAARAALQLARRDVYRCDPPTHKLGETYAEVTNLLQGYIENEVDMNPDGTCRQNCAFYNVAENHGCYDKKGLCSRQKPCRGRIINCTYIDSDMWICPADKDSNRRYNWVKYENGRTLGREDACVQGTWKDDSWWRWVFWHCSYCMCLCDETGPDSERYFSLRETTSDLATNKVVTGVRLIKLGRVFHLQISQGTLGERGSVTPGEWLVVNEFDPTDQEVAEGVDYHTLTYERRAIDLDELDSPSGNVLTGVRFNMLGPHLHLEIRYTPFNYSTGRMAPERSQWHGNYNTDAGEVPRSRLVLNRPDLPTRTLSPLNVDSKHDQYLEFTNTDIDADAAQSTVPFIDIQPVYPLKGASLISGAGIIHRGAPHNGGFVGVKLLTYDYSKHVTSEPAGALPVNRDDDNSVFETAIF